VPEKFSFSVTTCALTAGANNAHAAAAAKNAAPSGPRGRMLFAKALKLVLILHHRHPILKENRRHA
jgi:hypothetical protein